MIFATLGSPNESWLSWLIVVSFAACIGGILVFCGLWMEKAGGKEWFSNMGDLRRQKSKAVWGWRILMLGIFLEIISAGAFAIRGEIEMRQIRMNEEKIKLSLLPKPLYERIHIFLNEIDPTILARLKTNSAPLFVDMPLTQSQISELWGLYNEKGSFDFLGIFPPESTLNVTFGLHGLEMTGLKFSVSTNVLDGSKWQPPQ